MKFTRFAELRTHYAVTVDEDSGAIIAVPEDAARLSFVGAVGPFEVRGLTGGRDARRLILCNFDTFYPMTIVDEDPLVPPENRIRTLRGENITPPSKTNECLVELEYDAADKRWIVCSFWPRSLEGP